MVKRVQATPEQMKVFKQAINKCWIKFGYKCLPPEGQMVLVRFKVTRNIFKTYTGKFHYDKGSECDVGGMWPFPLEKARNHGVVAWMPIPL